MSIIRRSIILIGLLFIGFGLSAQQDKKNTQYMFSKLAYNPGAAGSGGGICINGIVRQQWAGFQDPEGNNVGPETFFLTVGSPVRVLHGAVGGTIMQDKLAFWTDISVNLGYTYIADIGGGNLGIGFQAAFINRSLDYSKFLFIDENDPVKLEGEQSDMLFDMNIGAYYEVPDNFYLGASSFNILQSSGKELGSGEGNATENKYETHRSIFLLGGYNYILPSNPLVEIKPSMLVQFSPGTYTFDLSSILEYNNKFWGGLNYRYQESLGVIVGVNFRNFSIGYSYDINTMNLNIGGSTHEIRLGYCFKIEFDKAMKIYRNTRFL